MKKIPLSRLESREQTRQRLLDAAQQLFVHQGYGATSVEQIAQAAGYTRGAFYSNFDSKPAIFLSLLKRDHERISGDLHAIFDDDPLRATIEARLLHYYSHIYRNDTRYVLWLEARLQASRDTAFRILLKALRQEIQGATADYIHTFSKRTGIALPMPAHHLASGFIALCDGMGFFYLPDDGSDHDEMAETVLTEFMKRVAFGESDSNGAS